MTLEELRKKRAEAWDKARNFLDSKRNTNGTLSEEDGKTYDALEKQIIDLGKEIKRLEKQAEIEAEMNKNTSEPLTNKPHNSPQSNTKSGIASEAYKDAFWNSLKHKHYYDVQNILEVGTDGKGGYLVPDEYERKLIQALEEENFFRGLATVIKTNSGTHAIPVVENRGEAVWLDENGSYSLSDDEFGQRTLTAHKLGTAIKVSQELLNDSAFDIPNYIAQAFARRMGEAEEAGFLTGDGEKKPTGIFDDTNGAETGHTTTSQNITFDDMMELYHSLKSPYRKKATWILNDQTLKALRKLKDSNGNYIWQPSISAGIPDTILNRPYHTSTYVPVIGSGKKCIAFGDYSYYWIADRKGRSFQRLDELFAMTGQVGFLAYERVDGKLILPEAVKLLEIKA